MQTFSKTLKLCVSVVALTAAASFAAGPVFAQTPDNGVETVTVTGSSIHGVAPVGSNLITVTSADIEKSGSVAIMDVFRDVPAISNFGAAPQGNLNNTYFSPNIHQLGASASNSTLVLIDSARVPLGGTLHALSDPGMVPEIAIDRIDVLATGASSIYGSDAVAGVVNFITRKSYDGLLVQGQAGYADSYLKDSAGLLWGTHWENGNVYLAMQYSYDSSLRSTARDWLNPNHTAAAIAAGLPVSTSPTATNFNSFQCNTATLQPGGSGGIYLSAAATSSVANTPANSPCNTYAYGDELPAELRESARLQVTQEFGPLTVTAALNYSYREERAIQARGGLSGTTVFSTGAQANPFYQAPAGYTGTATTEVVRWDADGLLGAGATNNNSQGGGATTDFYAHTTAVYHFAGNNFQLTWDNVLAQDTTHSNTLGALCGSCANLALNGTTNNSGSLTALSIPGTTQIVQQLPLTTANALDVWNPPGPTNRTSAAVLASLGDSTNLQVGIVSTMQERLVADGAIFNLPGGPVRIAVGAEYLRWTDAQDYSQPNNTGAAAFGGAVRLYHFGRRQAAGFVEVDIPIIGPGNALPFVQKLEVDISGRYDTMSDVGHTANPKFALDWTVADWLSLKANYSTAFVPPSLISVGDASQHYFATYASLSPSTANLNVPVSSFPGIAGVLPGCAVGATVCQLTAATPGIVDNLGGGTAIKPATGNDWSVAADFTPDFLPGFNLEVTLFTDHVKGLITSPSTTLLLNSGSLNHLFTLCPATCSAAQVNAFTTALQGIPLGGPLPSPIYYMADGRQANVIFLQAQGIDLSAHYQFETAYGTFRLSDNLTQFFIFNYANGAGSPYFSVLGTAGYTNTFPSLSTFDTAHIDWVDPTGTYEVGLYLDYTGAYHNWSANSVTPVTHDANGNPNGGGDHVGSQSLIDMHLSYSFPEGMFAGDQIYFDARNIFDWKPPYFNGATGYNANVSNPIGRLMSVGFRVKM